MIAVMYRFRKLSAFKVCDFGEARIYDAPVQDGYKIISKSVVFVPLPPRLLTFESWLPSFKLMDAPGSPVKVMFRLKHDAAMRDAEGLKNAEKGLVCMWTRQVLLPAIAAMETSSRAR